MPEKRRPTLVEFLEHPGFKDFDNETRRKLVTELYPETQALEQRGLVGKFLGRPPNDPLQQLVDRASGDPHKGSPGWFDSALGAGTPGWEGKAPGFLSGPGGPAATPEPAAQPEPSLLAAEPDNTELKYLANERSQALKRGDTGVADRLFRQMQKMRPTAGIVPEPERAKAGAQRYFGSAADLLSGGVKAVGALAAGSGRRTGLMDPEAISAATETLRDPLRQFTRSRELAAGKAEQFDPADTVGEHLEETAGRLPLELAEIMVGMKGARLALGGKTKASKMLAEALGFGTLGAAHAYGADAPGPVVGQSFKEGAALGGLFTALRGAGRVPTGATVGLVTAKQGLDAGQDEPAAYAGGISMGLLGMLGKAEGGIPKRMEKMRATHRVERALKKANKTVDRFMDENFDEVDALASLRPDRGVPARPGDLRPPVDVRDPDQMLLRAGEQKLLGAGKPEPEAPKTAAEPGQFNLDRNRYTREELMELPIEEIQDLAVSRGGLLREAVEGPDAFSREEMIDDWILGREKFELKVLDRERLATLREEAIGLGMDPELAANTKRKKDLIDFIIAKGGDLGRTVPPEEARRPTAEPEREAAPEPVAEAPVGQRTREQILADIETEKMYMGLQGKRKDATAIKLIRENLDRLNRELEALKAPAAPEPAVWKPHMEGAVKANVGTYGKPRWVDAIVQPGQKRADTVLVLYTQKNGKPGKKWLGQVDVRPPDYVPTEAKTSPTDAVVPTAQPTPTAAPAPVVELPQVKVSMGRATTVEAPGGDPIPATYAFAEARDLIASHNGTFQPNPAYPSGVQERAYHRVPEEQAKVVRNADAWKPAFIYNDAPTPADGPPIVTPSGVVLGGNSRVMTAQRILDGESRTSPMALREAAVANAERFGLDPEVARGMDAPFLIRRMDAEPRDADRPVLARRLNEGFTQAVGGTERGVSLAKGLSESTLETFADVVERAGEDATIRSALRTDRDFIKALERDGIIHEHNRNRYVQKKTGHLTDDGLKLAEEVLLGSVIPDADTIEAMPASWKDKVLRGVPSIVRMDVMPTEGEIQPLSRLIERAAESEIIRVGTGVKDLDDFLAQSDLSGTVPSQSDPEVAAVHRMLDTMKPLEWKKRVTAFAARLDEATNGQTNFLGAPPTPAEAFQEFITGERVAASYSRPIAEPPAFAKSGDARTWEPLRDSIPRDEMTREVEAYLERPLEPVERELMDLFERDMAPPETLEVEPSPDFWHAIVASPRHFKGEWVKRAHQELRPGETARSDPEWNPGSRHGEINHIAPGVENIDTPTPGPLRNMSMIMAKTARVLKIAVHENSREHRRRAMRSLQGGKATMLGEYWFKRGALNITHWGDIQTTMHEFMHGLVDRYPRLRHLYEAEHPNSSDRILQAEDGQRDIDLIRQEMLSVSYDVNLPEEGLSELMRVWMSNESLAHDVAPNATRAMVGALKRDLPPAHWKQLLNAQSEMHQALNKSLTDTYYSDTRPLTNPGASPYWSRYDEMRKQVIDKFHGLLAAERAIHGGPKADGAWEASHRLAGHQEIFDGLTRKGVITYNPLTKEFGWSGKPLREILKKISWSPRREQVFFTYARMRMAAELFPQRTIPGGGIVAPEDFAGITAIDTKMAAPVETSVYRKAMNEIRREERGLYRDLDVKNVMKKLRRLEKQALKSEDPDIIQEKIEALEEKIRDWSDANEALGMAKIMYEQAGLRDAYAKGKSREQKYVPAQFEQYKAMETKDFRQAFDELKEFHKRVEKFAIATGALDPAAPAKYRHLEYAFGLFKQMIDQGMTSGSMSSMEGASGVHTLGGSSRPDRNPMENLIHGPSSIIQLGLENLAKAKIRDNILLAPGGGNWGQRMSADLQRRKVSMDAVTRDLRKIVQELPKETQRTIEESGLLDMMRDNAEFVSDWIGGQKPYGDDVMVVYVGGKPEYWQLTDPSLVQAVQSFRPYALKGAAKAMAKMTSLYQGMVVMHPEFSLMSNLPRDVLYATIGTRTGWQHFTAAMNGLQHSFRESPVYWDYIAHGGGFATRYGSSADHHKAIRSFAARHNVGNLVMSPIELSKLLVSVEFNHPDAMPATAWIPRVRSDLIRPLQAGKSFGRHFEAASKLGEYSRAVRQGETKSHATFLGREVSTDFGVHGHNQAIAGIVRSMPFVSAMLNGNDNWTRKMFRKEHGGAPRRAGIIAKATTYALFSSALAMYYRDDEWYRTAPAWMRLAYDRFPVAWDRDGKATEIAAIPKAFEPGMLSNLTTIWLENMLENGSQPERNYAIEASHALWMNFQFNLPPPIAMIAEQASNRSLLTGAEIETMAMKQRPASERHRPSTPWLFKRWGQIFEENGYPDAAIASPARAEQAFRSLFGTIGFTALWAAEGMNDQGVAYHWDEHPFVRRILQRADRYDTDYGKFWELNGQFGKLYNAMNDAYETGDYEKALRYQNLDAMFSKPFEFTERSVNHYRHEIARTEQGMYDQMLAGRPGTIKERRRDYKDHLTRQMREISKIPVEMYRDTLRREEARP